MDKAFAKISKKIPLEKKIFKYLIIGSNGLLGNEFKKILNKSIYMTLARNNSDYNIDLIKFGKLNFFFKKYKFLNVINCAGITDLNYCEKNFKKCKKINSDLLKHLTTLSTKYNFKLVHISTDHFFKNEKFKLNKENFTKVAINKYALSKLIAEKYVKKNKNNLIIRTNFTGFKFNNISSTFVGWLLDGINKKKKLSLFEDMFTSTLDVNSCATVIKKLIECNASGVYNVGTKNAISKKNFAILFAKKIKKKISYEQVSSQKLDIKRGKYLGLNTNKTEKKLNIKMINSNTAILKLAKLAYKYNEDYRN